MIYVITRLNFRDVKLSSSLMSIISVITKIITKHPSKNSENVMMLAERGAITAPVMSTCFILLLSISEGTPY